MKRDKTATRPMSQGFTAVLSFLNCQRRDYIPKDKWNQYKEMICSEHGGWQ